MSSKRKIVFSKKGKVKKSPVKKEKVKKLSIKKRKPRIEPHSKRPGFIKRESVDIEDIEWPEEIKEEEEVVGSPPKPKYGVKRKRRLEMVPGVILKGPHKAFRGYLRDIAPDGSYVIELQATRQVVRVPKQDFREFRPVESVEDVFIEEEEPEEHYEERPDEEIMEGEAEEIEGDGEKEDEKGIDYKRHYHQHSKEDAIYFMRVAELKELAKDLGIDVEGKKSNIIKILDDHYQSLKPKIEKEKEEVEQRKYEIVRRAPTISKPKDAEEKVEPGIDYVYKDVEIEYGDLKTFAMQLGLPMKESRLVPVPVQRYVIEEAELKYGEDETRLVKIGKYGILVPMRGAFRTIKPIGPTELDFPEREEEEIGEKRSRENPYDKKYPRGTKVSFVDTLDKSTKIGLVVDFARPGISVLSEGKTYKISYKNVSLKILPKITQQEYVQLPTKIEAEDLYYARVLPESVIRKEVVRLFKDVLPKKNNVEKYEKEVYESLGANPTVYAYLTKVLFPYLFIEGVLSKNAKMFNAKIKNGNYTLVGCLKATLAHYLPELVMSSSFEKDPQALVIAGDVISELLKLQNIWFLNLFLRLMDPSRHKRQDDTIKLSFAATKPLESLMISNVISSCSSGGSRPKLDEQGQYMYYTSGMKRYHVMEDVPLGELVICYDPENKVFNCSSIGEVLTALEKDPKNPISPLGKPYPRAFIKKFKKVHAGEQAPPQPKEKPQSPISKPEELGPERKTSPKKISPKKVLKKFPLRHKMPEKLDLPELKNLAKNKGVKDYQKKSKEELVKLLSVKSKNIKHLTLTGNEFDVITLFADSLHFKVRGKDDIDIPISHDIKKNTSVVIVSFDAENYNEVKSNLKALLKDALKSKLDIYLVGVGDIVDVQKQVINRVFLKEVPSIRHIFFAEDDEDHLIDAVKNVVVDFTGKNIV